jgi:hypothetical protein
MTGCATAPEMKIAADDSAAKAEVRERIERIFDAAAKKEMPRLDSYHLYGPGFTKFGAGQTVRLGSRLTGEDWGRYPNS